MISTSNSTSVSATVASAVSVNWFGVREATGIGNSTVDNLLVGTTFGDVVPAVPEPATMSLLGLGALAMVLRRKITK